MSATTLGRVRDAGGRGVSGFFRRLGAAVAIAVAAGIAPVASAIDILVLKDGTTVEGEILREVEGNIWILVTTGTLEQEKFFSAAEIGEITRDATADDAALDKREGAASSKAKPERREGVPRGAVLTLHGGVGLEINQKTLAECAEILEGEIGNDGSGILVLHVNSGGGALLEMQRLSKYIAFDLREKFRTVAWIESAISAAAMSVHGLEEIYFMPEGNYGACTGWSGQLVAMQGFGLEQVFEGMRELSVRGNHDPLIMEAMQGNPDRDTPLSATIDPDTGKVTWSQSEDAGEELINPTGDVLTFNSAQAEKFRFSGGTAKSLDELTELLGYAEIDWVGRWEKGELFPVSKAEEHMRKYREVAANDGEAVQQAYTKYQISLQAASGAQGEARAALVGRARNHLKTIGRYVRLQPNFALFVFNTLPDDFDDWYEGQEETLRDLLR